VVNFLQQALASLGVQQGGGPGYPLAPTSGPTLNGDLLNPTNVAALPVPLQNSAVAVVPLMLTGVDSSTVLTVTPPAGYDATLITVNVNNVPTTFLVVTTASTCGTTTSAPATP
jgi:hypothetical protein